MAKRGFERGRRVADDGALIAQAGAGPRNFLAVEEAGAVPDWQQENALAAGSIVPAPPARPNVTPLASEIYTNGNGYTIAAGTQIYANSISRVFVGFRDLVVNNGTVWLEQTMGHAFLIVGDQVDIQNNGLIYLRSDSQSQLATYVTNLNNSGSIYVISQAGWARAVTNPSYASAIDNSGLIVAQSLGLNPESSVRNATAIEIVATSTGIVNRAGGTIIAEAPGDAIGIDYGGEDFLTTAAITNAGLIEARSTSEDGIGIGILMAHAARAPKIIVNSGTIRADIAIYATRSALTVSNPVEQIENRAGGVIEGQVFLDLGDDIFQNDGLVIGDVLMGSGNDVFFGSGRVDGVVDMGFDDDSYTGSGNGDRAVGGRGNDTLDGAGGHDLLMGGVGNDTLIGGAGNDGLYGEWGNDVINTSGGDRVDGGTGNDRIVLGDLSFRYAGGGAGTDTLVLPASVATLNLSSAVASGRIAGFEILSLPGSQNVVVHANTVAALSDTDILRIDATASGAVTLVGGWTEQATTVIGGATYRVFTLGGEAVQIQQGATVTVSATTPGGIAGLDPIADGAAAPEPGLKAGLDYTPTHQYLSNFTPTVTDFTVEAPEVFYSAGSPVFLSDFRLNLTNFGGIYSLDNIYSSVTAIDLGHPDSVVTNYGIIAAEQLAELGGDGFVFYYPSFGVRMGSSHSGVVENYGEISVYSAPGSAIGIHLARAVRNDGVIAAISENSRAIGANAIFGSDSVTNAQVFFNTGLIYAEAGGVGRQTWFEGDQDVPEQFAATGISARGYVTNDGEIAAVLGANAHYSLNTVGIYLLAPAGDGLASGVTNNGRIEGTIAIKFGPHAIGKVINNGEIVGHVELSAGHDEYDGRNGTIDGTVFGFDGNDTLRGGAGADALDGGMGNDLIDGGGGADRLTGGGGADTLIGGSGADVFVYTSSGDSVAGAMDYLQGFEHGLDKVDLRMVAARTLSFVEHINAAAGEHWTTVTITTPAGTMAIRIDGLATLADFILPETATEGDNLLFGSDGADVIRGLGGNDTINGGLGADQLFGDGGNDRFVFTQTPFRTSSLGLIDGGTGTDTIDLRSLSVTWQGLVPSSQDSLRPQQVSAGVFIPVLTVGTQSYELRGIEQILFGHGNNEIDLSAGFTGAITLYGGAGNDVFTLRGAASAYGEEGDDFFYLRDVAGGPPLSGFFDGGAGTDALIFTTSFNVDLAAGIATSATSSITFTGIEQVGVATSSGTRTIVRGSDGDNRLGGSRGDPSADNGTGSVLLQGRGGNDELYGGQGNDELDGGSGDDWLQGGAGHDILIGGDGRDHLQGGDGNDVLIGGAGADLLAGYAGGDGFDIYRYLDPTDSVLGAMDRIELFRTGWDKIDVSRVRPTGFAFEQYVSQGEVKWTYVTITTVSGIVMTIRVGGVVTIADFILAPQGTEGDDTLIGTDDVDELRGLGGNDVLDGRGGNDVIDGGSGADQMTGGSGDDVFFVDNAGDTVIELVGGGSDEVRTTLTNYVLADHVERLVYTGTGSAQLTGNGEANRIQGGSNADTLYGLGGHDLLDGGGGADTMDGGSGDDVYIVDNIGDVVIELSGGGYDEVRTSLSGYVLPANVERLVYTGSGGVILGNAGHNNLTGGNGADLFRLEHGGTDTAFGGGGDDGFYFGGAMDGADRVNGGTGNDQLALQGTYAGLTFNASGLTSVEMVVLLDGNDTRFANLGGAIMSYNLTTVDANVAAGQMLTFQANTLRAGENFTLNASAETDGSILTFGGFGTENITGGQRDDGFYFGMGRFGANDRVDGQGGNDQLGLQGDYAGANALTLGANQLAGIEFIVLMSAADPRFGVSTAGQNYSYTLTMNDGNVAAGEQMVISATSLDAAEGLRFNGAAELDGSFRVFSGAAADQIIGGQQADELWGGAGVDRIEGRGGADVLRGGAGGDIFVYRAISDSTAAARDRIMDFASGDLIDLRPVDANANVAGLQAFQLIGSGDAFTAAGQLRISQTGTLALVEADSNGDGVADFAIAVTVTGGHVLTRSDFLGLAPAAEMLKSVGDGHAILDEAWMWHGQHDAAWALDLGPTADLII